MRIHLLCLWASAALLASAGCEGVECGPGTIERDGACVAADETVGAAKCGNGTTLVGDTCTPAREPTVCGPGTVREPDTQNGVVVCRPEGGGGGGCGAAVTCPAPASGKQTICGQLYDLETNERFEAAGALGARCEPGATTGPCALAIRAFDAVQFAMNPTMAMPLAVGESYLDDCGRYRLADITVPTGPFIGLGIDDAAPAMAGPLGITNVVGLATARAPDTAVKDFEAFIASKATTDAWTASGGPPLSGGIYAMLFRERRTGTALSAGVTATVNGAPVAAASDHYFAGCSSLRTSIDAAANATGGNGTALVTGATLGNAYSGAGGLPAECRYSAHAGVALPNILFVQVARPTNNTGMTCPL